MPTKQIVLAVAAAFSLISGCQRGVRCPSSNDLRAVDLRGEWNVEIIPDWGTQLKDLKLGQLISGSLELATRDSSAAGVIYTGAYTADFQSVGLFKTAGEVLASAPAGDTVRIILDPNVDHGNMELVAHCMSGAFGGRWKTNGDPSSAMGHFHMLH